MKKCWTSVMQICLALVVMGVAVATAGTAVGPVPSPAPAPFSVKVVGLDRPPMLLIPGLNSSGEVWDSTVAHYQDRFQVHVLTLAGFAGEPAIAPPFLPRVRDAIIEYLGEQRLARPVLVGHSLGGFLALGVAATSPDAVGAVVSVDGVPFLPALRDPAATQEGGRAQAAQMRTMLASFTPEQATMQARMALGSMITDPVQVDRAIEWAVASDPATTAQAVYELLTTDLREDVARIQAPVLLVGALGAATPEARETLERAYASQLRGVKRHELVMAAGARHFVMLDDPTFLFATMDRFLGEVMAAPEQ